MFSPEASFPGPLVPHHPPDVAGREPVMGGGVARGGWVCRMASTGSLVGTQPLGQSTQLQGATTFYRPVPLHFPLVSSFRVHRGTGVAQEYSE
jgi:hypothetical protein